MGIALVAGLFTFLPQEVLRYERQGLGSGEYWRLLTAHLAHLGPTHLILNLVGLALLCELLWEELPACHGAGVMLIAALNIDWLLWVFQPQVQWYAGLSGLVHALWAACVTAMLWRPRACVRKGYFFVALAGGALLVIKLTLEITGMLIPAVSADSFPVISVAHAYGALTGVTYVLLWRGITMMRDQRVKS